MPWPQSQDYNEAIQNPQSSFGDPELRGGQAVTNAMGMPMPRSGNFADVYEFIGASGQKWAIKCFTRQIPGLQERYGDISKSLAQAKLPFMVDFDYLAKGIRIRGEFYPVLKMHWVEGLLLNEFVRNNLEKPAILDKLAQIWIRMAARLREAGIAHADLQHGNVILVPGSKAASLAVKLIDYDGMWLPALAGKKSGEVGHANYQHPERLKSGIYSFEVDRFPNLLIYTALRSLIVGGPDLWNKYDNGDNLLFKQSDLDAPDKSPLFAELLRMNNSEVHILAELLLQALARPLDLVPHLEQCAAKVAAAASGRATPARPAVRLGTANAADTFGSMTKRSTAIPKSQIPKKMSLAMPITIGILGIGILVGVALYAIPRPDPEKRSEGKGPFHEETGSKPKSPTPAPPIATPGEPQIMPLKPITLQAGERVAAKAKPEKEPERLFSGSLDNTIKVWDLESGKETLTLRGYSGTVNSLALSGRGNALKPP